jgi:hypothetical protein
VIELAPSEPSSDQETNFQSGHGDLGGDLFHL